MQSILLLGGLMVDKYYYIDHMPLPGQDVTIEKETTYVGGCPFNVANTLQQLLIHPYIYSYVYNDDYGTIIKKYLHDNHFNTSFCFEKDGSTGYCMIMLDQNKERTFFSVHHDEGYFDPNDVSFEKLKDIKYVYLTGIYLTYPQYTKQIRDFIVANKKDKTIIFDASPLIATIDKAIVKDIVQASTIIKANDEEYAVIKEYIDQENQLLLVTHGANGADLYHGKLHLHQDAYPVQVKDTSGSGDNFLAGFIYATMKGFNYSTCLQVASACGAISAANEGTYLKINVDELMNYIS